MIINNNNNNENIEIPWKREWLPTPVFLPEELHGQTMESERVRHD